jgi:hypothetical protein
VDAPNRSARRRARLVATVVILCGSIGFTVRPAWACSCLVTTLAQKLGAAGEVFVGDIVHVEQDPADASRTTAGIEVLTVYKGSPSRTESVSTATDPVACGVPFEEAKRYLVFATRDGARLNAGLCGGTTGDLSAAAGLVPIRAAPSPRPAAPRSGSSTPLHVVPVAIAVALLGAVAVAQRFAGRAGRRPVA